MAQLLDFQRNGFKMIAVRTLPGCDENYLKIIKPDEIYYFYNNYQIDKKTDTFTVSNNVPDNFYGGADKNTRTRVNLSAVVGKNGSGKSTLIELLFRAINNLSCRKADNPNLQPLEKLKVALYFQTNGFHKVTINNGNCRIYDYDHDTGEKIPGKGRPVTLQDFFYTIAINYSHYAYNVDDFEDEINWLDGLFHKNDGYQTPLVLNPLRTNGNIDINTENTLVKARLIANFVSPSKDKSFSYRDLTDKHRAIALKLTLKPRREKHEVYINEHKEIDAKEIVSVTSFDHQREQILDTLNKIYNFYYHRLDHVKYVIALDYIIYKLISICLKYTDYHDYLSKTQRQFHPELLGDFLAQLMDDESHITFKLKQTLNFLRFQHIELLDQQIITLDRLSDIMLNLRTKHKRRYIETVFYIPPPIFDVQIVVELKDEPGKTIPFKRLSSGEKQMVYSISTILYHLVNLESIKPTRTRSSYKYVNVVLEEVELYFHPEMQRQYISNIIKSISGLNIRRILGVNLCFITHSPFILSDIPTENILFLGEHGYPQTDIKNLKTFGANIHDLLAKNFFLAKGAMGEFARNKIQQIIDQLNPNLSVTYFSTQELLKMIALVGEPFLHDKLMEMFYLKYDKAKRIEELKNELKSLGYDQA